MQMEPKSAPTSSKIVVNEGLETHSKTHAEKVQKRESPDPQQYNFRTREVTKINKSSGLHKITENISKICTNIAPNVVNIISWSHPGKDTQKKHRKVQKTIQD